MRRLPFLSTGERAWSQEWPIIEHLEPHHGAVNLLPIAVNLPRDESMLHGADGGKAMNGCRSCQHLSCHATTVPEDCVMKYLGQTE